MSLRDHLISRGLSNRESEVAELTTKGLSNKEISDRLFITEKTVRFHLTNIYKKLDVKSRAQLIVYCLPHFESGSVLDSARFIVDNMQVRSKYNGNFKFITETLLLEECKSNAEAREKLELYRNCGFDAYIATAYTLKRP